MFHSEANSDFTQITTLRDDTIAEYNPSAPARFELAVQHQKASAIYSEKLGVDKCSCCGSLVNGKRFKLSTKIQNFKSLGSGCVLYFLYFKWCILLLLIMSIYSIGAILMNLNVNSGNNNGDSIWRFDRLTSLSDKSDQYQNQLEFIFASLLIVVLQRVLSHMKFYFKKVDQDIQDEKKYDISIYTVEIKFSDDWLKRSKYLKSFLNEIFPKGKITEIEYAYDLEDLVALNEKINEILHSDDPNEREYFESLKEELKKKRDLLRKYSQKKLNIAFVTFNKPQQARAFIATVHPKPYDRFISYLDWIFSFDLSEKRHRKQDYSKLLEKMKNSLLENSGQNNTSDNMEQINTSKFKFKVDQAPEATDVEWENLDLDDHILNQKKKTALFYSVVATIVLSSIIFGIEFSDHTGNANIYITVLFVLFIVIFSELQVYICEKITHREKNNRKTLHSISLAKRILYSSFLCSIFGSTLAIFAYYYMVKLDVINSENFILSFIFHERGLFGLMSNIIYIEGIFEIICFLLKMLYQAIIPKLLIKRKWKEYTQAEANKILEYPKPDFEANYAIVTRKIYFVAFFCPIFPLAPIIAFIFLILVYWIEKYKFVNISSRPPILGAKIAFKMIDSLRGILILLWLGSLCIFFLNYQENLIAYLTALVVSLMFIVSEYLGKNYFGHKQISSSNVKLEENYEDIKEKFTKTYKTLNPFRRSSRTYSNNNNSYSVNPS